MAAAPLLERARELETIDGVLRRLGDGSGALVLVEGPSGIGKTSLLAEAARLARQRGMLVRQSRGGELERGFPFGVARQLLEPVLERSSESERARLLAGSGHLALIALASGGAVPARVADPFAPIHGLYWLLAAMAESGPVVLSIDDAHWADVQTLRLVDYLSRRMQELPVLVLLSVRTGEPDEPPELERLRLQAVSLRPRLLSRDALQDLLAAELLAPPAAELVDASVQATAGNPLLIAELMRSLRDEHVDLTGDAAAIIGRLAPRSVARYALVRLGRFGQEAITVARVIAVLAGAPQLRHVATLAGVDEPRARSVCDRLREAAILTPGLPIDFVHPLVRQAIYRELPEGARSELHRRAAELLASTGADARDIAPHLVACAPNGDQWVVAQLAEAAWAAIQAGAYDTAQTFLERARAEPPEEELPLAYALGRCMLQTETLRGAQLLVETAGRATGGDLRVKAFIAASHGFSIAAEWGEAARCCEQALMALPSSETEKRLIAEAELHLFSTGSHGRQDATTRRLESVAAGLSGASPGEALARQVLGLDRFLACAPVEEVVALAASHAPEAWRLRSIIPSAACRILSLSGRWNEARPVIAGLVDTAARLGLIATQSYQSSLMAEADRLGGRLVDSEAEARTALEIAGAVTASANIHREAILNLAATLLARGEIDEAQALVDTVPDLGTGMTDAPVSMWPLEMRGFLKLARGELEGAVHDLLEFGDGAERMGAHNPAQSPWRQEVAPALAALGRTAEAEELVAVAEARARAFGAAHVIGTVLRARALIEPRDRRLATLRESVDALQRGGPPHELARSLLELGAELRRQAQRVEAREPLRRALELAYRSGAGALERRAREELAAAGARPRRSALTGRDALTATEHRIAAMAAGGMTNRQIAQTLFLSPKTVENHLGRVYGKLAINSRSRLADVMRDQPGKS